MNKTNQKIIDTLQVYMSETKLIWHNPCIMVPQSNLISGKGYKGINQFITSLVSMGEHYSSPYWATYKQISEAGGTLENAKGKGVPILFYRNLPSKEHDDESKKRFTVNHSFVFNLDLVTGLNLEKLQSAATNNIETNANAESLIQNYLAHEKINLRAGKPAYVPSIDTVQMPDRNLFTSTDELYSTFFHELGHSTGHSRRLNRFSETQTKLESKEDYSKEELVAEITSALLCHNCDVDSEASIKNSAAYIQGWSTYIKNEADAFLWAVSQAYIAKDFILSGGEK